MDIASVLIYNVIITKIQNARRIVQREVFYEELYQKILKTYHKSRIKTKYHFRSYSVLLGNLAMELNSVDLSKKAIRLCLRCGKLNQLPHNYMTYICALTDTLDKTVCRKMIEECITLCELTKNTENLTTLRQYYQKYIQPEENEN